mgnify:CR=1 FL=1
MSRENEVETEVNRSTVTRTIRLTPEVLSRLQAVCEHLGVTVGSYITQEVGRAVARDEVSLLAKQSKDSSLEMLARMIDQANKEDDE